VHLSGSLQRRRLLQHAAVRGRQPLHHRHLQRQQLLAGVAAELLHEPGGLRRAAAADEDVRPLPKRLRDDDGRVDHDNASHL
jgi:hypothetical protein